MNCPYCSKEMEKGYINGRDHVRWIPEGVYPGDAWMYEEESVVLAKIGLVSSAKAESWYCPDCRMVITPVVECEGPGEKLKKKWDSFAQRVSEESEKRQSEREVEKREKQRAEKRKKDPWEV